MRWPPVGLVEDGGVSYDVLLVDRPEGEDFDDAIKQWWESLVEEDAPITPSGAPRCRSSSTGSVRVWPSWDLGAVHR